MEPIGAFCFHALHVEWPELALVGSIDLALVASRNAPTCSEASVRSTSLLEHLLACILGLLDVAGGF